MLDWIQTDMGMYKVKEYGSDQGQLLDSQQSGALTAAAHDLKAPLASVQYLAASIRDNEVTLSEAERQEYLWRIQLSAQRGLQLIEGLTYAYNSTQLELDLEPVNVVHLCEDVLHDLRPFSQRLDQTVELRMPKGSALALAHHTVLRSVITNLCDNAIKHNPAQSRVVVRVAKSDGAVFVDIRDNGPKLSSKDFNQLKDRLGKEINPLGARAGNSGLGLYIASQLAGAMHGKLDMVRHQQSGLTLRLQLMPSYQLSLL